MADLLIVDAHVHAHRFDPARLLDTAAANFEGVPALRGSPPEGHLAYLLLTEGPGEDLFVRARAATTGWGDWRLRRTGEPESIVGEDGRGRRLVLVAGRQVATRRGLEVLAIGTLREYVSGLDLAATLQAVMGSAALAVVPWGFGKWLGGRGRLVEREVLGMRSSEKLFLGDNGGRLGWTARPGLMARAEAAGVRVLPGSDPLPMRGQLEKVGATGFTIRGRADPERPLAALLAALAGDAPITPYGDGENLPGFVLAQVRMQLRKRFGR